MSEADFDRSLVDASQLVSVILVFLSVLFGLKYQPIVDTMSTPLPDKLQPDARRAYRQRLIKTFLIHVLPVGLPSLAMTLLLAPNTVHILRGWDRGLKDEALLRALFLGIEVFIAAAAIWTLFVSIRILVEVSRISTHG